MRAADEQVLAHGEIKRVLVGAGTGRTRGIPAARTGLAEPRPEEPDRNV